MSDKTKSGIDRRDVLRGAGTALAGAAAMVAVSGKDAMAAGVAPRWVMVMDLRKCIGCRACTVSCKSENDVSLGRFRTVIQEKTTGTYPNTKKGFLPLMCNHCEGN
ncbi:MAG: hypothetical protein KAI73_04390, partial [Rhodospirillaceae bacterium]|nr:hypothetical protein [Rhodospirillaceae bacterium]